MVSCVFHHLLTYFPLLQTILQQGALCLLLNCHDVLKKANLYLLMSENKVIKYYFDLQMSFCHFIVCLSNASFTNEVWILYMKWSKKGQRQQPKKKEEERKKETYLRPVLPESNARIFTEANVLLNSSLKTELEYNLPDDHLIPRELWNREMWLFAQDEF